MLLKLVHVREMKPKYSPGEYYGGHVLVSVNIYVEYILKNIYVMFNFLN